MLTAVQDGVFTRGDALRAGLDDAALRRLLRARAIHRIRHGAYTTGDIWAAADQGARHVLACRAVARSLGGRVAFSHTSAALLLGLDVWGAPLRKVHVTRLDGGSGGVERDVVHHVGRLEDHELQERAGLLVTSPCRTVLDHARLVRIESGLVTADAALRTTGLTGHELEAAQQQRRHWPEMQRVNLVARMADGGAESVGESRSRYLFWSKGVPRPQLQYEIRGEDGELLAATDFGWPHDGVLGEFDGRVKYGRLLRPGQDPGEVVFDEKRREDMIRELTGFRMVRLVWADLADPEATAARIKRMLRTAA